MGPKPRDAPYNPKWTVVKKSSLAKCEWLGYGQSRFSSKWRETMRLFIAVAMLLAAAPKASKPEAVTISAENIKYGPIPPVLPAGAQLAVLHGDPGKKPAFAVRLK